MAIKFDFIKAKNAKLVCLAFALLALLIFIWSIMLFTKKNRLAEVAAINSQSINLTINSDENKPVIAIVIEALGSLKLDSLKDLPKEITIAVPSYIDIDDNNKKLLNYNFALNISMEDTKEFEEILKKDSLQKYEEELNSVLNKKLNYQALYSSIDESNARSSEIEYFLKLLQAKNLIYLSGLTDKNALIYEIANKLKYIILRNDINLDQEISFEYITNQILELENIAKESGFAVATGSAYPLTLKIIREWVSTLSNKGIKLVSIKDFYTIYSNKYKSAKEADKNIGYLKNE